MAFSLAPIESEKIWEAFLLKNSPGALFQSWLWGEVQSKLGVPLWRYGVYHGTTLVGLAQIIKVTARRGPFLQIRHGPVFDRQDKERWKWFLGEVKALAKDQGAWFVRLNPLIENSSSNQAMFGSLGLMPAAIHAMDAEYAWVLDLNKTESELLAAMRKTTRYEIKHAQALGVQIEKSTDPNKLAVFFDLYRETAKRQGFVEHKGIQEEFAIFAREEKAVLFTARLRDQIHAAAIILFVGHQGIYHHSASTPSSVGVNYLLQWEAICEAKKRGMNVYNFWGIAPNDSLRHPWRGITLFKTGFGGRLQEYIHAHDLPVSPFYGVPRLIESWRRWRKGY
ncbi:peptidoglycan bridge formation glycyltransferase FemA/FemB family protein [Candidatus Gottesmanbacteria bacterium]|nr:peptidoglycan bridge formation glycyltransferase FemA/FemB family protein [Candidatus Gottesmanbacteria bacterium]